MKNKKWTKVALAVSAVLFVIWWALGTGATLAWFSDNDTVRNEFQVGLLKLDVQYKNDIVTEYTPMLSTSEVFYDEALYEPGYTQVVYLKIDNLGNVPFNYKAAVMVKKVTEGTNVWGEDIYLPDYLRYGIVFGKTEEQVRELVADRLTAREHAPYDWGRLDTWSEESPYTFAVTDEAHYAALIVYMPEEVDNVANYRGMTVPKVELGVTVFAQQANVDLE